MTEVADLAVIKKILADDDSLARATINCRETITTGIFPWILKKDIEKFCIIAYACRVPSKKRRTSMDPEEMVGKWVPLIKKMAIAHDIDEKDAASSALDEHLLPILNAPVAQIREFYKMLVAELKDDPDVPWAIWRMFEFWGENILEKINKEEVVGLKKEIATRIAEHAEAAIPREDWINSMVGALQWRSPEKLEQIEASLKAGAKPRVRGKESCLFLEVEGMEVML